MRSWCYQVFLTNGSWQNNGVIAITRCANITAGRWCCVFLLLFGILGKISGVFLASKSRNNYFRISDAISSSSKSCYWRCYDILVRFRCGKELVQSLVDHSLWHLSWNRFLAPESSRWRLIPVGIDSFSLPLYLLELRISSNPRFSPFCLTGWRIPTMLYKGYLILSLLSWARLVSPLWLFIIETEWHLF